jgi:hypothetical protein
MQQRTILLALFSKMYGATMPGFHNAWCRATARVVTGAPLLYSLWRRFLAEKERLCAFHSSRRAYRPASFVLEAVSSALGAT